MKKFLKINTFLLVVIIVSSMQMCFAEETYYPEVFHSWGVVTHVTSQLSREFPPEIKRLEEVEPHTPNIWEILRATPFTPYALFSASDVEALPRTLVLLASQVEADDWENLISGRVDNVVLICDSSIKIGTTSACTFDGFENIQDSVELLKDPEVLIYLEDTEDIQTTYIPESSMLLPAKREVLEQYFRSLVHSKVNTAVLDNVEVAFSIFLRNLSSSNIDSSLFFAVKISLLMVVVYLVHSQVKKIRENSLQSFSLNDIQTLYEKRVLNIKKILKYGLFALLFIAIPLLVIITYRDKANIDLSYMIGYVQESLNPENLTMSSEEDSNFRIVFAVYIVILMQVFLLYCGVTLVSIFLKSLSFITAKKPRESALANGLIVLWISCFVSLALFDSIIYSGVIVVTLFTTLLIDFYARSKGFSIKFSSKQILFVLPLLFGIFVVGNVARLYVREEKKMENLLPEKSNVIYLPYHKWYGDNVVFKRYTPDLEFPLFFDDYLVYYPNFGTLINSNLKDFEQVDNFFILNSEKEGFIREFLREVTLRDLLKTNELTNYFYLPSIEASRVSGYKLSVNCDKNVKREDIRLIGKYFEYSLDVTPEYKSQETTLLHFPGCSGKEGVVIYEFPITLPKSYEDKLVLFELHNIKASGVEDFELFYEDGSGVDLNFLKYDTKSPILYSQLQNLAEPVYSYSLGVSSDVVFESLGAESVDIAARANLLLSKSLLKNPFQIWSLPGKLIVMEDGVGF